MKKLFLLRHAKSSWKFPNLDDIERPLNKRGYRDAPRMGQHLKLNEVVPDAVISSPAERAFQTARIICEALNIPSRNIQPELGIYHAGPNNLLQIINKQKDQSTHLLLVGHNPGLTELANLLADSDIDNIPTCGIVGIKFDKNDWAGITYGAGEKMFFYYPRLL